MLQPIAVDLKSLSDALADAQSIAVGFTQVSKNSDKKPDKEVTPEYHFPSYAKIVEKLEKTFEINLRDELAFFAATGKAGEIFEIPVASDQFAADRILLIGLGDETTSAIRQAGAALGRKGRGKAVTIASLCVSDDQQLKAFAVSVQLGAYIWTQKTGPTQEIPLFLFHTGTPAIVKDASTIANAISRTRDLIHTPSNIKTPLWLADEAVKIATDNGLEIKVLAGKDLADFGGLRAVGNSSPKPGPRFVEITYHPKGKKKYAGILPHVVIVGKGITFDTGGVSLKRPYEFMTAMK